jgi:hypothetical protein
MAYTETQCDDLDIGPYGMVCNSQYSEINPSGLSGLHEENSVERTRGETTKATLWELPSDIRRLNTIAMGE